MQNGSIVLTIFVIDINCKYIVTIITSPRFEVFSLSKCGKGTELHGGTLHRKIGTGRGDNEHTFLMSATNGVGTPQNIERKHILGGGDTAHTLLGWRHCTKFKKKA